MRPSCSTTVPCAIGGREIGSTHRAWYRIMRSGESRVRVEQVFVARPAVTRERERKGEVADLISRVAVGAQGHVNAAIDGAPNEALERLVARGDLEGDPGAEQRGDEALLA